MNGSVTPAGASWTPPLKKMDVSVTKCPSTFPSPLDLSKVKHQSTPTLGGVIVPYNAIKACTPSSIHSKLELSITRCFSSYMTPILREIEQRSTPSVNVPHNVSTVEKVDCPTVCTPSSIHSKKLEVSMTNALSPFCRKLNSKVLLM